MLDSLFSLLSIDPALLAKILPIIVLCMGILSGLAMVLNAVAKFTKGPGDDKAAGILGKVIEFMQKLIDFISGNVKH
mgnify:CR=1 FL=1